MLTGRPPSSPATTPGRLRRRLVLERDFGAGDGAGGALAGWLPVATVFADLRPLDAGPFLRGEGLADRVRHRAVIRFRADVRPGDRFRLGDRLFDITGVLDPGEDGRFLVCLLSERRLP